MYSATSTTAALPKTLFVLPAVIFVMVTSEFMVSPLLPQLSVALNKPLGQTSLLITALAAGQSIGGVTLGVLLTRARPTVALAGLAFAFAAVQLTPLISHWWPLVLGTRVLAGALMASMFTVALTAAGNLAPGPLVARASGIVFSGVTFGLTVGSPLAGWLGNALGWQWAFGAVSIAGVATGMLVLVAFRAPQPKVRAHSEHADRHILRSTRLWATYLTAFLLVGSAAAAYSFFGALLTERAGFSATAVSMILLGYGVVSIVGNLLIARFSGRAPVLVVVIAATAGAVLYLVAAAGSSHGPVLVGAVLLLGGVGFTVNPAVIGLVVAHSGNNAITNALAATSVTLGIVAGSAIGGALVDHGAGLTAPLYLAAAGAVIAIGVVQFARPIQPDLADSIEARARSGRFLRRGGAVKAESS